MPAKELRGFGTNNPEIISEKKSTIEKQNGKEIEKQTEVSSENTNDSFMIHSPVSGETVDLSEVPDETFAQEILGKGCAVIPSDNIITAPADAVIETIFNTHHAVGLKLENGCEILIHVGINTVELKGQGFTAHVSEGDKVTAGQTLITFDREFIQKKGYNIITPVLVTNADDYKDVQKTAQGNVMHGEELIQVCI